MILTVILAILFCAAITVLLLSGGQDVMLPANENCQAVMERLRCLSIERRD